MKQIQLFIPKALNNGEPILPTDLSRLEEVVQTTFGACTLYLDLRGIWTNARGLCYHDSILMVEIAAEDSPALIPSLLIIAGLIRDLFHQQEVFIVMADVVALSVRRSDLIPVA